MRFVMPAKFDGAKFAARYGLDSLAGDFWASGRFLYIRKGIVLPDKPPIFEAPDPSPATTIDEDITQATTIKQLKMVLKRMRSGR